MMLSEMERFPEAWMLDYEPKIRWQNTSRLVLKGAQEVYERTNNKDVYNYISDFADLMINKDGSIKTYNMETYNLEMLNN